MECKDIYENIDNTSLPSIPGVEESLSGEDDFSEQKEFYKCIKLLTGFFPMDKVDWEAGTYDQYLYDLIKTVLDNYAAGNYQVSYFYAYLIFMSYVYYSVEKVFQFRPDRMKDVFYPINAYNGRRDKPDIENYQSVYEFSKIPEKEIFKIFYVMGMDTSQIHSMSSYISSRDNYAHATGEGNISAEALTQNIMTIKGNMQTVHKAFFSDLKKQYVRFLLSNVSNSFLEVKNNIDIYISENSLSLFDIAFINNKIGLSNIIKKDVDDANDADYKKKYRSIKNIHCAFIDYCIENYASAEPDNFKRLRNDGYLYWRYENNAEEYIERELKINEYDCVKDGGEFPLFNCPDCDAEQMVYNEQKRHFHCFGCGANYLKDELIRCEGCGVLMHNKDIPLCSECLERKLED